MPDPARPGAVPADARAPPGEGDPERRNAELLRASGKANSTRFMLRAFARQSISRSAAAARPRLLDGRSP